MRGTSRSQMRKVQKYAEVAQLVERKPEELGVGSSTLPLGTNRGWDDSYLIRNLFKKEPSSNRAETALHDEVKQST